jgi:hypothetical protein
LLHGWIFFSGRDRIIGDLVYIVHLGLKGLENARLDGLRLRRLLLESLEREQHLKIHLRITEVIISGPLRNVLRRCRTFVFLCRV